MWEDAIRPAIGDNSPIVRTGSSTAAVAEVTVAAAIAALAAVAGGQFD
jgi:hypothetical protein